MAAETLVTRIEAGKIFIEQLDTANFKISAALWLRQPPTYTWQIEVDAWQLVIATPLVKKIGIREVYERISSILEGVQLPLNLSPGNIRAVEPNDELIRSLRSLVCIDKGYVGAWLRRRAEDEVSIEEAYVYRMT